MMAVFLAVSVFHSEETYPCISRGVGHLPGGICPDDHRGGLFGLGCRMGARIKVWPFKFIHVPGSQTSRNLR